VITRLLPTTDTLLLSVAERVIFPIYVPGTKFAADGLTLTPNELPLPVSCPGGVSESQELLLLFEAVQVIGKAQLPVSLRATFCAVDAEDP